LSIVHGIAKSYHGFIRVESEVGKGTTFRLYFPGLSHTDDIIARASSKRDEQS
jgi:signal transduction histidine kinase